MLLCTISPVLRLVCRLFHAAGAENLKLSTLRTTTLHNVEQQHSYVDLLHMWHAVAFCRGVFITAEE